MEVKDKNLEQSKEENQRSDRRFCTLSDKTINNMLDLYQSIEIYSKTCLAFKMSQSSKGNVELACMAKRLAEDSSEYLCFISKFLTTCGYEFSFPSADEVKALNEEEFFKWLLDTEINITKSLNDILSNLLDEKDYIDYAIIGDNDIVEHRQCREYFARRAADIATGDGDWFKKGKLINALC